MAPARHTGHTGRAPAAGTRLTPTDIRAMTFRVTRRGLDEAAVYRFLDRIADEITRQQHETNAVRRENETVKESLRDWQSAHAACHTAPEGTGRPATSAVQRAPGSPAAPWPVSGSWAPASAVGQDRPPPAYRARPGAVGTWPANRPPYAGTGT